MEIKQQPMTNEYKTRDLHEATVLLCKKQQLLRLERNGRVCVFVFTNQAVCEAISYQFWFGKCLVDAKKFVEAQATLKARIFAE